MPAVKRIVCLANSRKLAGRCLAGKELGAGTWIRPVSAQPNEEVSEHERQYEDGRDPAVLDVIDVPLLRPKPKAYQAENWLLDPKSYWTFVRRCSSNQLGALADDPPTLWFNGASSNHGLNDRVRLTRAGRLTGSLYFLRVERLVLRVFSPGAAFGDRKRRAQGRFRHRGITYHLWVTDPAIETQYLAKRNGLHPIGACYLTVSLGEPFRGYCYKLIAAVVAGGGAA